LRHAEDDGDHHGSLLGGERGGRRCGRNHGDTPTNQIGRKLRQSIELTVSPAKFERNILAFDVSCFLEALAKSAKILSEPASPVAAREQRAAKPQPRRREA
jgi:hypothetical protein